MSSPFLDHCTAPSTGLAVGSIIHYSSWSNFWAKLIPSRDRLDGLGRYLHIRIAGGEGVVVGEDDGFGAGVSEL